MTKNIWIDLDNSPHVPLFVPLIEELQQQGHHVIVTARDYAQTVQLLQKTKVNYLIVGKHYGKNKFNKVCGLLIRAKQLIDVVKDKNIDVAVNHGSRSHVLACKLLGIPVFCGADYEHTESFLFSKLATKMWIPVGVSDEGLKAFGVKEEKVVRYNGYKEELYLDKFHPGQNFMRELNVGDNKILVTLRPPATQANYHNKKSEQILESIIQRLKSNENIYTICVPRTKDQQEELKKYESENFRVLDKVVDGLSLAYYSDLLISGGGTMNREAALLGTPVYSIFAGELGSLDAYMEKVGMIRFIRSIEDVTQIEMRKKILNHQFSFEARNKTAKKLKEFLIEELIKVSNIHNN